MKITGVGILVHGPKLMKMNIHMFVDPTEDETRLYNCGGLPVELTLPEGEHDKDILRDSWGLDGSHYFAPIEEEISYINKIGSKYCRNDGKN